MEEAPFSDLLLFLRRHLILVGVVLVGLILLGSGLAWFLTLNQEEEITFESAAPAISVTQTVTTITVDVAGAVNKPGVYSLPPDARLKDALTAAGGVREDANEDALAKSINLAQKLSDSQKIYIPFEGEAVTVAAGAVAGASTTALINLNAASLAELDKLPKVGEVTAQKIIDNRPYASIQDLLAKKVVSSSVFTAIEKLIAAP